jgi:hypothetical protein
MGPEAIVIAVLFRALRGGAGALRCAGWRALAVALLYLPGPPLAYAVTRVPALAIVVFTVQNIATFAVVRLLAAYRPGGLPDPPAAPPVRRVAPVGTADRSPLGAARAGLQLVRPALRLGLVQLLALFGALIVLALIAGGDALGGGEEPTRQEVLILLAGSAPLVALVTAFIAVAPQRIALEGDPRVMLAVANAARVAGTAYGTLFTLALAEPLLYLGQLAAGGGIVAAVPFAVANTVIQLVVIAACTEVYLAGPRLDLEV